MTYLNKNVLLSYLGAVKFDTTHEHDMNLTRFLRVLVEYNRVDSLNTFNKLVIFMLTCLTRILFELTRLIIILIN